MTDMVEQLTDKARRPKLKKPSVHQRSIDILVAHYSEHAGTGLPKHVRVRNAILGAIRDDSLKAGDQIPPEHDLRSVIKVSLGTIQKALRELSFEGTLVREHGRGTFVANSVLPTDEIWQFRFGMLGDLAPMQVATEILSEDVIVGPGRWADALGQDSAGYLKIIRIVHPANGPTCFNEIFFRVSRFAGLRFVNRSDMRNINIKVILTEDFNAPTLSVTQKVRATAIPAEACSYLGIDLGTIGMEVDVVGHSFGKEPITLQRIWFPSSDCYMDMTPKN